MYFSNRRGNGVHIGATAQQQVLGKPNGFAAQLFVFGTLVALVVFFDVQEFGGIYLSIARRLEGLGEKWLRIQHGVAAGAGDALHAQCLDKPFARQSSETFGIVAEREQVVGRPIDLVIKAVGHDAGNLLDLGLQVSRVFVAGSGLGVESFHLRQADGGLVLAET